jgi:transcriptional regulator with XRE-family HTH domain
MKINAETVVALRKKMSWSQEELATAAGINLRTIQRIEADGTGSLQSIKALASAFDVKVNELEMKEKPMRTFEYKTVTYKASLLTGKPSDNIAASLNKEGEQGWRLVEMVHPALSGMGNVVWALLERETTKRA